MGTRKEIKLHDGKINPENKKKIEKMTSLEKFFKGYNDDIVTGKQRH